jgi:K+-transporting ATPase KdpF subunit
MCCADKAEPHVTLAQALAGTLALLLLVYLVYALVRAEDF